MVGVRLTPWSTRTGVTCRDVAGLAGRPGPRPHRTHAVAGRPLRAVRLAVASRRVVSGIVAEPSCGVSIDVVEGAAAVELTRGAVVGRYVLLDRLGAGNMGVVHAAYDPELDRKVALKLVLPERSGVDTHRLRLLREAQALAKLAHPNVVAVHDVGTHGDQVWIAMEFVHGRTLGQWAKERPRRWPELLRVLADVARGVAAAHAAGLVHRDLKPDNVMIDHDERVRVMDFGLAHGRVVTYDETSLDETLSDNTQSETTTTSRSGQGALVQQLTQVGVSPGTPAYMAPEQWRGHPTDAAADQFSWSILAWELLYGERPFHGASTMTLAVAVTSGRRQPPPRGRRVPGWLRRVLERGLSVERADRWPSMTALLTELGRGHTRSRLRTVGVAALGVAALVGVAAGLQRRDEARQVAACAAAGAAIDETWNDETRAAVRAAFVATGVEDAAATADRVIGHLDERTASWQRTRTAACEAAELRGTWTAEQLVPALWCLEDRQMQLAALIAEFTWATPAILAQSVGASARISPADTCLDEGMLRRLPVPPEDQRDGLRAAREQLKRASSLDLTGDPAQAREIAEKVRTSGVAWPPLIAAARAQEALALVRLGKLAEAEAASTAAYFTASHADAWSLAASAAINAVYAIGLQGRFAEGRMWGEHAALAIAQAGDQTGEAEVTRLMYLGVLEVRAEAFPAALDLLERSLALGEATYGSDALQLSPVLTNLALVHTELGHLTAALPLYARAVTISERVFGPEHIDGARVLANMGATYYMLGRLAEARDTMRRSNAEMERVLGRTNPVVVGAMCNLGQVLLGLGELAEARKIGEQALALVEQAHGLDSEDLLAPLTVLALHDIAAGEYAAARTRATRALAIAEAAGIEQKIASAALILAESHHGLGAAPEARAAAQRAFDLTARMFGPEDSGLAELLNLLARIDESTGDLARATAQAERAVALTEDVGEHDPAVRMASLRVLADLSLRTGDTDAAVKHAERAAAIADKLEGRRVEVALARFTLARALISSDRPRALALATAAQTDLRAAGPAAARSLAELGRWMAAQR